MTNDVDGSGATPCSPDFTVFWDFVFPDIDHLVDSQFYTLRFLPQAEDRVRIEIDVNELDDLPEDHSSRALARECDNRILIEGDVESRVLWWSHEQEMWLIKVIVDNVEGAY